MSNIRVANAPCSWGTLEFEGISGFDGLSGERIEYERMLDELVWAGYTGTELGDWEFMPTDPEKLREELEKRELDMLGSWVGVAYVNPDAHAEGVERAVTIAKLLAEAAQVNKSDHKPFIVLGDDNGTDPVRTKNAGRITSEMMMSDEQWKHFTDGIQKIATAVRDETGVRTVFHPHCAGYIETLDEIARFLDMTDPELVGIAFDTGHIAYGLGKNNPQGVIDALDRFEDRIRYIHFKDCHSDIADQARAGQWDYFQSLQHAIFCELGKGFVDFSAVKQWMEDHNYQGWVVVEQDVLPGMGDPKDSAKRNREFLRSIGF